MQIDILDKETEAFIQNITDTIKLRKNGVSSDAMRDSGIEYKMNYGVSIVHLRQIAKQHSSNNKLAKALWNMQWRETMILASLMIDVENISTKQLDEICSQAHTDELYQQLGMNVVCNIKDSQEVILCYLKAPEVSKKSIACYAIVRRAMLKTSDAHFMDEATKCILTSQIGSPLNWSEINAMSKALSKTGTVGTFDKSKILDYFAQKSESHSYWKVAYENVKTEFEYS